jgi:hypothetical protein
VNRHILITTSDPKGQRELHVYGDEEIRGVFAQRMSDLDALNRGLVVKTSNGLYVVDVIKAGLDRIEQEKRREAIKAVV